MQKLLKYSMVNFKVIVFFVLSALCLLIAGFRHVTQRNESTTVAYAQKKLNSLEVEINRSLDTIASFHSPEQFHEFFIHHGKQEQGFSFFYFENGKLQYWSDNKTSLLSALNIDSLTNGSLIRLPNGIYEAFVKDSNNKKIIGLLLIKKEYAYENKYLVNSFNPKLHLPDNALITAEGTETISNRNSVHYPLYSFSGKKLVSVSFSGEQAIYHPFTLQAWLYLFAYVFILLAVFCLVANLCIQFSTTLVLSILLVALRLLMIWLHTPAELYDTDFFSPKFYASSFIFHSIGDLLLNALTAFMISVILFISSKTQGLLTSKLKIPLLLLFVFIVALLTAAIHTLFVGLIIDSKISFDINNILNLNANSLAGLLAFMLFLWGVFFIVFTIYNRQFKHSNNKTLQPLSYFILLLFSAYTTFVIIHYSNIKERENQKLFAQRIDSRQDHLAEYLFEDIEKRISRDSIIFQLFHKGNIPIHRKSVKINDAINKRLQQFYFNGYWNKFDIYTWCFDEKDSALQSASPALQFFQKQAADQGRETYCDKLFFLQNESGRLSYLAILPLLSPTDSTAKTGTIVIRLDARLFQTTEGFPELFVSSRIREINTSETSYSFARYYNGALVSTFGNYPYSFTAKNFSSAASDFTILKIDNFVHLVYRPNLSSLIVVSRPEEGFFKSVSLFSYVLLFFAIFFFSGWGLVYTIQYISNRQQKSIPEQITLKQRIRFSFVALVIVSFLLIASGTIVYIVKKYDKDQDQNILSRLNSLWNVLYDNFTPMQNGVYLSSVNYEEWSAELNQLADNLNLDYNLYDESGSLFYSSQGKIFDESIISTHINPEALFEMNKNNRTQFVHPENVGKLNYIAAYAPFTDQHGNITGYVNLPYFQKQNELKKEISGFLSALINIYVLLLVIAIFLALFISSRITKPLLLIQERLKNIREKSLGFASFNFSGTNNGKQTSNLKLEWNRNDEIGELVREYNHMVTELEISAEKLARSERESAWREMAQQVAHEIKNPLTPMKLSVQHLQKAWADRISLPPEKAKDFDELFHRISKTLIEQINTLSNIATEFSNFAKMPKAKKEVLDLHTIIQSSINLFENTPGITIHFEDDNSNRIILADKEQLMRVFSNLIKNAIQSINEDTDGTISIKVRSELNSYNIEISDNGIGIAPNFREKIFTPYFTTKTSGMGLGLAMVKSIIEELGGSIHFESELGVGTTFFISLPLPDKNVY